MGTQRSNAEYTIDNYTGQFQDAITPRVVPEAGETYRVPEDVLGTGQTADGREWGDFSRRCREAGLDLGHYSHTEGGWDYYDLVEADDEGAA